MPSRLGLGSLRGSLRGRGDVMQMYMFHGRRTTDEHLEDWGFDGPVLKHVVGCWITYNGPMRVVFTDGLAYQRAKDITGWRDWDLNSLQVEIEEDMLVTRDEYGPIAYYGDWGIEATDEE